MLVVEDNPITLAGLEIYIKAYPDLLIIGQVPSGEQAIEFCGQSEPDVIIMDMNLPGMDGAAATTIIKQLYPRIQVVALSMYDEGDMVEKAYAAGVSRYVLKTSPSHVLINAIWSAYLARDEQI
jgi:DNA-binding NarL/FixJ family response regulator